MLSAIERNSTVKEKLEATDTLKDDLKKSGFSQNVLGKIVEKLHRKNWQTADKKVWRSHKCYISMA